MIDTIINSFDIWSDAQGIKSRIRIKSVENISLEGISRLRELILDLAVCGRLVPQNSNEESAKLLLKKIANKKKELVKEGAIKKQKAIADINENEKPFKLPWGWEWARLDSIAPMSIIDGDWIEKKDQDIDGKIRLIQLGDIGEGSFINKSDKFINEDTFKKLKCTELQKDDILIARLPNPIGRACLFPGLNQKSITAVDVAILRTLGICNNHYLVYSINSNFFRNQIQLFGKGVTRFRISTGNLKNILLPVAPLEEQYRIVSKIDELMFLCDKLEKEQFKNLKTHHVLVETLLKTLTHAVDANELQIAWERMSTHFDALFCTEDSIDQLKQTVLQLAVMGKLVKQNPDDEPATELLKKIEKEKEELVVGGKLKKPKILPNIDEDAKPFNIPSSWIWVPWGSILAYDDYPFKRGPFGSSLKKDMFIDSGYKVYEQYCPINDDCSFERYYISDELYEKLAGFAVKENDYLVSCSGATLGRITQVPSDFKEGIINQALLRVRMNHKYVDKDFFKLLFRSPYFQKMIFDNSTGSAIPNVKGVNELKIMPVPFLSLDEQQKIVRKIIEIYGICDNLKKSIVKSQKLKGLLSKVIVEKAIL